MSDSRATSLTLLLLLVAASPAPASAYSFVLSGSFDGGCCSSDVYAEFLGRPFELTIEIDPDVVDLDPSPLRGVYPEAIRAMTLSVESDVYRQQTSMGLTIDLGQSGGVHLGPDRVSILEPAAWEVTRNGLPSDRIFSFEGAFGGPILLVDDSLASTNVVRDGHLVRMVTPLGSVSGTSSATLVPEPGTALLITSGLAALSSHGRRTRARGRPAPVVDAEQIRIVSQRSARPPSKPAAPAPTVRTRPEHHHGAEDGRRGGAARSCAGAPCTPSEQDRLPAEHV